jgi:hypothetical protein
MNIQPNVCTTHQNQIDQTITDLANLQSESLKDFIKGNQKLKKNLL